jgi:hypothetical protein
MPWQAMAERWGADGRIAFELWNEPIHTAAEYGLPAGTRWRELKPAYHPPGPARRREHRLQLACLRRR